MFRLVGEGTLTRRGKKILKKLAPYHKIISLEDFFSKHSFASRATFYVEKAQQGALIGLIRQSPHRIILFAGNRIAMDEEAQSLSPIICCKANRCLMDYISQFLCVWAKYIPETKSLVIVDIWDKAKYGWASPKLKKRWCKQMAIPMTETLAILRGPRTMESLASMQTQFEFPIILKAAYKDKTFIVTLPEIPR